MSYETNLNRWRYYMKDCISPNSFIDWGFYSVISAALERRVWSGSEHFPLFCNLYVILVAPSGEGKGRTIDVVKRLLKELKLKKGSDMSFKKKDEFAPKSVGEALKHEEPTVIQVGADSTTYQSLVRDMSQCARGKYYKKDGAEKPDFYWHSSLTFCLDELSSLFREHLDDLVRFLYVTYDCGDYTYSTIVRGRDMIRKCCLNIIAGTTYDFIKEIFNDRLINEGFASRAIFICEKEARFKRIRPVEISQEQLNEYNKIVEHLQKITNLYGEVKFTEEALCYLDQWWQKEKDTRVNKHVKLIPYYARKDITVKKMACIFHFSDHTNMEVGLEEVKRAIRETAIVEETMHGAVTLENKNPLAKVTAEILNHLLINGGKKEREILMDFYGELPEGLKSLHQILDYLKKIEKIKYNNGQWEII